MARAQSFTTTPGTAITQTYSTTGTTVPAPPDDITGGESPTEAEFNALNQQVTALTKLCNTIINALKLDNTLS